MSSIRAIETRYKGYRFRSRTEARWAVFFDALGVRWDYEPEGLVTLVGGYLPDFYLPSLNAFVEVKGHRNLSDQEIIKCAIVSLYEANVWMHVGNPAPPKIVNGRIVDGNPITLYGKGMVISGREDWHRHCVASRSDAGIVSIGGKDLWFSPGPPTVLMDPKTAQHSIRDPRSWFWCERPETVEIAPVNEFQSGIVYVESERSKNFLSPRLLAAYTAARSARFEHGETPEIPKPRLAPSLDDILPPLDK